MLTLPHRSASGALDHGWEYDSTERRILCNVRDGAARLEFGVWICSTDRLVIGAHPITRMNEECWRVLPERVIKTWPNRMERLETIRCSVHGALGCVAILLTNTPAAISAALEAL